MQRMQRLSTVVALLIVAAGAADAQGRGRGRGREGQAPGEVANDERQRRMQDEQRRDVDYRRHLDEQIAAQRQQEAALQAQRRVAQYRAQQEYYAQLARQQAELRAQRDYSREAYISAPHTFRYHIGGVYHETNQFGVDVLHDAVNDGCQQGYRAGVADRLDHWRPDYSRSPAYIEATYGYAGRYIDQSDHSYYFRQGFQRCYNDGYYSRTQYGTSANGGYSLLAGVLAGILGLTAIR